jgi:hypothetical protein
VGVDSDAPTLDPGRGREKIGQLWGYPRDDRRWGIIRSDIRHIPPRSRIRNEEKGSEEEGQTLGR